MLAPLILAASAVIYVAYAWLYYHPRLAHSPVVWVGVALALLANVLWVLLARSVREPTELMFWSLASGLIIDASGVLVPVAAFGVRPSPLMWAGLLLALAGLGLVKYASLR